MKKSCINYKTKSINLIETNYKLCNICGGYFAPHNLLPTENFSNIISDKYINNTFNPLHIKHNNSICFECNNLNTEQQESKNKELIMWLHNNEYKALVKEWYNQAYNDGINEHLYKHSIPIESLIEQLQSIQKRHTNARITIQFDYWAEDEWSEIGDREGLSINITMPQNEPDLTIQGDNYFNIGKIVIAK